MRLAQHLHLKIMPTDLTFPVSPYFVNEKSLSDSSPATVYYLDLKMTRGSLSKNRIRVVLRGNVLKANTNKKFQNGATTL